MLARGRPSSRATASGMIAEWATAAVRQGGGTVETGAPVEALEADGPRVVRRCGWRTGGA